jgi:hypothetical protein
MIEAKHKKNRWPRCPTCHKQNVELIEIWDATISSLPDDPYYNEGDLEPGDPKAVEGHCLDCDHSWKMRGVAQVQPDWFVESEVTNEIQTA